MNNKKIPVRTLLYDLRLRGGEIPDPISPMVKNLPFSIATIEDNAINIQNTNITLPDIKPKDIVRRFLDFENLAIKIPSRYKTEKIEGISNITSRDEYSKIITNVLQKTALHNHLDLVFNSKLFKLASEYNPKIKDDLSYFILAAHLLKNKNTNAAIKTLKNPAFSKNLNDLKNNNIEMMAEFINNITTEPESYGITKEEGKNLTESILANNKFRKNLSSWARDTKTNPDNTPINSMDEISEIVKEVPRMALKVSIQEIVGDYEKSFQTAKPETAALLQKKVTDVGRNT
ncbi:MAG: hypothetical protein R3D71_07945 [Rickettsiales bacterium]